MATKSRCLHFTFGIPSHKMMNYIQLLLIVSIASSEPNAKGRISRKTSYPGSTKVSYGSFHSFGSSSVVHPGSTVTATQPVAHTVHGFSQARETYSETGSFPAIPSLGDGFTPTNEGVPLIGENFLKIHHVNRNSHSFAPVVVPLVANRRQGIASTGSVSFGMPSSQLEELLEQEWATFKTTFNKTYSSFEEERQRREIFIENRNKIARFNQEYGIGRYSFVQKLNQYGDLLNHEFSQLVNGFNRTRRDGEVPQERRNSAFISAANVALPGYVDWREAGAVTSVKRQGMCGACYAFAATGALEGQTFRRTGRLVDLSPQNLIDCTDAYTNNGCVGGLMEYAFDYIRDNRGIDTESAYPFEERDGQECRYRVDGYGAHDTGYVLIDEDDEQALEVAVATIGPVAIGFDAHPDSFQFYSNGIYFDSQCSSSVEQLNHAMLVVGYGTEPNGQQYWLIKNSYGPEWGIGGYMKLAKFSNNHCGIASYALYPLL